MDINSDLNDGFHAIKVSCMIYYKVTCIGSNNQPRKPARRTSTFEFPYGHDRFAIITDTRHTYL